MARDRSGSRVVDVKIVPPATYVSFVGAVDAVLRTRRMKCDAADIAGMSGYGFVALVADGICPSGPTSFDWTMLEEGLRALGMEAEVLVVEHGEAGMGPETATELFDRVRQEVDERRCCVVWGATDAPEFGVVYGYESDSYLVRSYRSVRDVPREQCRNGLGSGTAPEPPVRFDGLRAPGQAGVVFFGERLDTLDQRADRASVARGVKLLQGLHPALAPDVHSGAAAFDYWAETVLAGEYDVKGNAYTVCCWQEMQSLAAIFCRRLADRHKRAADDLRAAADFLAGSAESLESVSRVFPFPGTETRPDAEVRLQSAEQLVRCGDFTRSAGRALQRALALF